MRWAWWWDTWAKLGTWTRLALVAAVVVVGVATWTKWREEPDSAFTREERCQLQNVERPDYC